MENKTIHLAVLGSTRGTDLQTIINAIESSALDAKIEIVISNKSDAYILQRAREHNIEVIFIDPTNKTREQFDAEIIRILETKSIDLILLIGYMRILSAPFIQKYPNRIVNVHPSLLPAFAGGMNTDVHAQVLASGVRETGCTVHFVDEGVDTGKIILQKRCAVEPTDTVESLKNKVQKLEGEALIEVIKNFKLLSS